MVYITYNNEEIVANLTIYSKGKMEETQDIFSLNTHIINGKLHPAVATFAVKPLDKKLKIFTAANKFLSKMYINAEQPLLSAENGAFATNLIQKINQSIEKSTTTKTVKSRPNIFDSKNLIQPLENPNQLNKRAWAIWYKAVHILKSNTTRDTRAEVSPIQFHSKQQQKLMDMSDTNTTISYKYIDEICSKAKKVRVNIQTNVAEVKDVIKKLSASRAYDSYDMATSNIKQYPTN